MRRKSGTVYQERFEAGGGGLSLVDAIILGLVQGLTEFLPVSSSGHLVLGGVLLGLEEPQVFFDIALHVATLAAVLLYYRQSVADIARQSWAGVCDLRRGASALSTVRARPGLWLLVLLVVGSVPTVLVALAFKHELESLFGEPRAVAGAMIATAAILLATRFLRPVGRSLSEMSVANALVIGLAQGIAIIPGLSRSGSTIGAGVMLGLNGELAARYSFLLSVPAILGAVLLKLGDADLLSGVDAVSVGAGCLTAFVVGFIALKLFIPLVRGGRLHYFAPYLVLVAAVALLLLP